MRKTTKQINDSNPDNIEWIFHLKEKTPKFLSQIQGKAIDGYYHYSLSGDLFTEKHNWGLGNSVFFLKIIYTLKLEKLYTQQIKDAIHFIQRFQKRNGEIYDPIIRSLSRSNRIRHALKTLDFSNIRHQQSRRAETRQSLSALALFNYKPRYEYKIFPKNQKKIEKYINRLNWELPWSAGSHISHLLFFLYHSKLAEKEDLIEFTIRRINRFQHSENGFWYKGNPSLQQKINGAMKIITGLKVVDRLNFEHPDKMIDQLLVAQNDEQACDNFNIVYVLKYCDQLLNSHYRYAEIQKFSLDRLNIYKEHYFPSQGAFSFFKTRSNTHYYNAHIASGKNEPDIHGTVLFLWGISIIAQALKINDRLQFREFVP